MLSWESTMLRTPSLPWTSLHIKQEPIENNMVNTFVPNHSDGFPSSSPSSSSRGSPPAVTSPSFRPLTPPGFETSPENRSQHQTSAAVTPPKSPSPSPPWVSNSEGVPSPGADSLPDGDEEPGLRVPAVNSHGKVKTFKCKQCEFVAVTKLDFWDHTKSHIKPERMLNCPKCPFVTEYKHHLEYHMRNHFGSKPFQCPRCSYSCVNKSMLNSHLKSHSNIYQYRCADCNYATKYCHSLKLHLRKYQHQPAMVLNNDGTPNPLPIIDVYGTRRGPKQKSHNKDETLNNNNIQQQHSIFQNPFGLNFPYGSLLPHPMLFPNNNNINDTAMHKPEEYKSQNKEEELAAKAMQNLSPHLQAMHQRFFSDIGHNTQNYNLPITLPQISPESRSSPRSSPFSPKQPVTPPPTVRTGETPSDALDLTSASKDTPVKTPLTPTASFKNRRKGRAFKLDRSIPRVEQNDDSMETDEMPDLTSLMNKNGGEKIEIAVDLPESSFESIKEKGEEDKDSKAPKTSQSESVDAVEEDMPSEVSKVKESYDCQYCDIVFKNIIMYTMHMGYHGFKDPFTCNMCGQKSDDKVSFFVHIARSQHS